MHTKTYIFVISIPILLVAGLVVLFFLYRSSVETQLSLQKSRLLYQPAALQSQLFQTEIDNTLHSLDACGTQIAGLPAGERENWLASEAGRANTNFFRLALIGPDALLYDATDKSPRSVSDEPFYTAAAAGGRQVQAFRLDGQSCFAFSVPFTDETGQRKVLAGFLPEHSLLKLLSEGKGQAVFKTLLFNADGNIVAGAGQIPQLTGQTNVYTAFARLEQQGALKAASQQALRRAVSERTSSPAGNCIQGSGGYYVCLTAGVRDWYILNFVPSDYLKGSERHSAQQAEFIGGLVLLSALLALTIILILRRQRIAVETEYGNSQIAYTVDPLTLLYNKSGFEKRAAELLAKAPPESACALVSFEIVAFRSYNTLYGFDAGDELLRTIARILRSHMRQGDVAGRLYADHFAMYLCRESDEEIYATLRKCVRSAKDSGLPFYLCAGIYKITDRGMSIAEMTDYASIAKNTIKYKFTTGVAIYNDSMLECQREDAKLVGSMMSGLENGEFVAYYQPKYSLNSESITSAEALVRWKKPDGEIIMPGRFIELFERNGYIRRLDYYMFESVCAMLRDALRDNRPVVPISVNFSRVHLYDAHFPDRIAAIAKKYGVDPSYLIVELTESAFIMEGQTLIDVVETLHKKGFSVAIDDFGSGFSSLNMLKDVDVDELKIDMKFLEGFERGGKVGTVVTSVIRMAKWLGIPAVAEGVETRAQIDFLRTLGCDMIQGYYYSRPVPREEFERKLQQEDIAVQSCETSAAITLENINAVLGADNLVTTLIDGIFGGFGLYAFSNDKLEAIRVNKAYLEILGYPDMGAFSMHSLNVLTQIYPPDTPLLLAAVRKAVRTEKVQRLELRRYTYDGTLGQYRCYIKSVGGTTQEPLVCLSFIDAAERMRADCEKELNKYSEALYSIFDDICEFNYPSNIFRILSKNKQRCVSEPEDLRRRERFWLANTVSPTDRSSMEALADDVRSGRAQFPMTVEYRILREDGLHWVSSTMVEISGGSYLLCTTDVTQKKQFEQLVERMEDVCRDVKLQFPPEASDR